MTFQLLHMCCVIQLIFSLYSTINTHPFPIAWSLTSFSSYFTSVIILQWPTLYSASLNIISMFWGYFTKLSRPLQIRPLFLKYLQFFSPSVSSVDLERKLLSIILTVSAGIAYYQVQKRASWAPPWYAL